MLTCVREQRSDTAVIFLHGFWSDSRSAWGSRTTKPWFKILQEETSLEEIGIYLFDYTTGLFSGNFTVRDASNQLHEDLRSNRLYQLRRLVFVCHSMGGIVARNLIGNEEARFVSSNSILGLLLVASPSMGSSYASFLHLVARVTRNKQLQVLRFIRNNPDLDAIDERFRNLKSNGFLPICGKEIYEDTLVGPTFNWLARVVTLGGLIGFVLDQIPILATMRSLFQVDIPLIVDKYSAAIYFSYPVKITSSTHTSIAKPSSDKSQQHTILCGVIRDTLALDYPRRLTPARLDYDFVERASRYRNDLFAFAKHSLPYSRRRSTFRFEFTWVDAPRQLKRSQTHKKNELVYQLLDDDEKHLIMLFGRGGAGKTSVMQALLGSLEDKTIVYPFYMDLTLKVIQNDDDSTLRSLLNYSIVPSDEALLMQIAAIYRIVVLIDGFNQVIRPIQIKILKAVYQVASTARDAKIIIADRLQSPLATAKFRFASICPLSESIIKAYLKQSSIDTVLFKRAGKKFKEIMAIPFFLDLIVRAKLGGAHSFSEVFASYFKDQLLLDDTSLQHLISVAFDAYVNYSSYTSQKTWLRERLDASVFQKLVEAGVVSSSRDDFDHQLFHDYLAARHISAHMSLWTPATFDAVTLGALSFDSLGLCSEQIPAKNLDKFLREVYDWNYRAAVTCLDDKDTIGFHADCTDELRVAILSLVAEKRLDRMSKTARKVELELENYHGPMHAQFKSMHSRSDIIGLAKSQQTRDGWYREWVEYFSRPDGSTVSQSDVLKIADPDSVIGWTLANTLKRMSLTSDNWEGLRTLYRTNQDSSRDSLRWRIVHALGASTLNQGNIELLFVALNQDPFKWARYGALRSIIESASLESPELRGEILAELSRTIQSSTRPEKEVIQALSTSVFITGQPVDWHSVVSPVLENALNTYERDDETARDLWSSTIAEFNVKYSQEAT